MRKRSETTKQTILRAAHTLFLEYGYAGTSMEQIADTAAVSKQTLYGYFSDKRSLFTGVIEAAVGTPWDTPQVTTITSPEILNAVLYKIASGIDDVSMRPDYIKLLHVIVTENRSQPELGELFKRGVTYQSLQTLTDIFNIAKGAKIIDIADPTLTARFFLGGFVICIFLDGLLAQPVDIKKQSEGELHAYVDEFVSKIVIKNKF